MNEFVSCCSDRGGQYTIAATSPDAAAESAGYNMDDRYADEFRLVYLSKLKLK